MRNLHTLSVHGDFDGSFLPMGKGVILNMFIRVIQNTDILELGSEHFTPHLDRPNDHLQLFRRLLSSSATSREPP